MSEPPVHAVKHRSTLPPPPPPGRTGMRSAAPAGSNSAAPPGAARCAGGGHRGDRSPRRAGREPLPGASSFGSSTPPSPRRCWCRLSLLLPFPPLPSSFSSFSLPCSALTAWDSHRRLRSGRSTPLFPPFAPFCLFLPPHLIPRSHEAPDPPPGAVCAGGALDRRSPPPLLRGEEEVGGGGTREPNAGGKGAPGAAGIPPSLSSCVESLAPCPRSGSLLRRGTDALSRRRSPLCRCRTRLRCRDGAHRLPRRGTSGHRAERERPPGWAAPRPPGSRASTASAVLVVVLRLLLLFPFVIVVSVCTGCDLRSEGERQRPRLSISALSRCRVAVRTSRRSDGARERHGASNPTRRGKARSSAARAAREAGRLQGSRGAALMAASWPGRARG